MQGAQTESRFRGIGRYSLSLALAIAKEAKEHDVLLALNGMLPESINVIREAFSGTLPLENIRVWNSLSPTREIDPTNSTRRQIAERIREAFIESLNPDIVLITSLFEGFGDDAATSIGTAKSKIRTVVILYDLIPLLTPDIHFKTSKIRQEHYARKIESLKKSNHLLAISESARIEAMQALAFSPDAVTNISGACDVFFRKISLPEEVKNAIREKFNIPENLVLYTGGADERKNLARLIAAYALLPLDIRRSHRLLMAGRMPDDEVKALRKQSVAAGLAADEVVFTGYISDDELLALYNMCRLFVFPSTHEGFGIPPLEAMSCGAVVIAAQSTSLPEVVGSAEAMFDPESIHSIARKIHEALTDGKLRQALIENAAVQSGLFSWGRSARRALEALEKFGACNSNLNKIEGTNASSTHKLIVDNLIEALSPFLRGQTDEELADISRCVASSIKPTNTRRRIFVDISELAQRDSKTGIQRVTRSILKELLLHPPRDFDICPVYATEIPNGYFVASNFINRFTGNNLPQNISDGAIDFYAGDIFLGLDFQTHIVPRQTKSLDAMKLAGVKIFFVVYDLLSIQMPQNFVEGTFETFSKWLDAIAAYDGALCISKSVAADLSDYMEVEHPERSEHFEIGWFHIGADIENSNPSMGLPPEARQVLESVRASLSFLAVGTVEPRKGHAQVLNAFDLLWAAGFDANLIIVGKQGWLVDELAQRLRNHGQSGKRLFWLESISDEYLERLYESSSCLIAASEGEGFGLPLIEAARHGIPIIARDLPVFKEVAGQNAQYFHGVSAKALADAIQAWSELFKENTHPTSGAMPWLTWRQATQDLLKWVCRPADSSLQLSIPHTASVANHQRIES